MPIDLKRRARGFQQASSLDALSAESSCLPRLHLLTQVAAHRLVDLDPEQVIHSGRLGPGQMLLVDLAEHKFYEDGELLALFDAKADYAKILEEITIPEVFVPEKSADDLLPLQHGFGYTKEEVRMILVPMATEGKDAVWSMGDDTPLAFLAKTPRPVYAYFRQRFAQVTNPAIDPLREAVVVSLHTRLGPWPHLLDKNAPLPGLSLPSPFLSLGQMEALRTGAYPHSEMLRPVELKCLYEPGISLADALNYLTQHAQDLVRTGTELLILSDRGAGPEALPIPMALAVGVVHHALVDAGMRTHVGLAIEAGD